MKGESDMEGKDRPLTEEEMKNSFNGGPVNTNLLLPLLMAVFSNNNTNVPLEREVAYLHGKVDALEKIIMDKKMMNK